MPMRLNYSEVSPGVIKAMMGLENHARKSGLEPSLLELVKVRASQLNGCAYCLDMHTKDARAAGETELRLYGLSAWREAPYYTARERAALAFTESVTLITMSHVSDEEFNMARKEFSEKELVDLTLAIVAINGWNRLAIAFRSEAGHYRPRT
ncbi:MAG: carboxymuconolactone decarboxylase family protein [Clostridia bacterium]|nr:carboxymuconolactone decarboxylase family protein [Clostridia bacterium]